MCVPGAQISAPLCRLHLRLQSCRGGPPHPCMLPGLLTRVREKLSYSSSPNLSLCLPPSLLPSSPSLSPSSPTSWENQVCERAASPHAHLAWVRGRPTGHLVCPPPAFVWPSACQLWEEWAVSLRDRVPSLPCWASLSHLGPPRPFPLLAVASPQSPPRLCCCLVLEGQNQVISLLCSASPSALLSHLEKPVSSHGPQGPTSSGSISLLQSLWPLCHSSNLLSTLLPQGLCTRCSCPSICMICLITSCRSLLKCYPL